MRDDIQQKLNDLGITDTRTPNEVSHKNTQWVKKETLLDDGKTLIEYEHPSKEPFPVCFVTEDPEEARAMMKVWLKENGKI